ncbi:MAG: sigma-70 family RNA polymerase sigma factor [Clostridia bacterium]
MEKGENGIKIEDLDSLISQYSQIIKILCKKYYYVGGNEDDLFQEAMIGFLQAVKSYDIERGAVSSDAFKKFALMCAKRQIIDAIKKANAQKNKPLNNYIPFRQKFNDEGDLEVDIRDDKARDPEEWFLSRETGKEKLSDLENAISSFEKQVLRLYLDGKSQVQIAEILDKPLKSIENTLQRVRNKLK